MQKPYVLAVETSAAIGSVAIGLGEQILSETTFSGPMRHSSEIFGAIDGLLSRSGRGPKEIEHIYISVGPGSFTGLRIAVTIAKTMHLANAAKIVAVDTLDVIAANAVDYVKFCHSEQSEESLEKIATILDAKRGQFFIAVYQRNHRTRLSFSPKREPISTSRDTQYAIRNTQYEKILPDSLMTADEFLNKFACKEKPICLLGEGLVYNKDKFKADGIRFLDRQYWTPRAQKVHLLGWEMALKNQFADPLILQPAYLRKPDVKIKPR